MSRSTHPLLFLEAGPRPHEPPATLLLRSGLTAQRREPLPVGDRQLVVFVSDGSPSMGCDYGAGDTGIHAVGVAVEAFLAELRSSPRAAAYEIAEVAFSDEAHVLHPPRPLAALGQLRAAELEPHVANPRGTSIASGLELAGQLARTFLAGESPLPRSAVLLVLSDGQCSAPERSLRAAEGIDGFARRPVRRPPASPPRVRIATSHFRPRGSSSTAGRELLRELATQPSLYADTQDAASLVGFFRRSTQQAGLVPQRESVRFF